MSQLTVSGWRELPARAEMKPKSITYYVVAANQKEAEDLAEDHGHLNRSDAEMHLKSVQAPPTDQFYARMYKVFAVRRSDD